MSQMFPVSGFKWVKNASQMQNVEELVVTYIIYRDIYEKLKTRMR